MKQNKNGTTDISTIERQLLDYLAEHPNAEDTLEGIAEWWLLEWRIRNYVPKVREALESLVEKGKVETRKVGRKTLYRLSRKKQSRDH